MVAADLFCRTVSQERRLETGSAALAATRTSAAITAQNQAAKISSVAVRARLRSNLVDSNGDGQVLSLETKLNFCRPLIVAGASLHWLVPQAKQPISHDWSSLPTLTYKRLVAKHRRNSNIGIRLGEPSKVRGGYIHVLDFDVRKPEQIAAATAALTALLPNYRSLPTVISGSGGPSRHYYFITDRPFRSKKLVKSETFSIVHDAKLDRGVKKNDWEIELFGTGKQVVLPPSIHPDTGKPYVWQVPFDFDELDIGGGPFIPYTTVAAWGAQDEIVDLLGDLNETAVPKKGPLGLNEQEVRDALDRLPEDWVGDRDQWLQVGAACHNEFGGSQIGFNIWCEWSKQSDKFDKKDQGRVWKSFGDRQRPVRMATILQAVGQHRIAVQQRMIAEMLTEEEDEIEDAIDGLVCARISAEDEDEIVDLLGEDDDGIIDLLGDDDANLPAVVPAMSDALAELDEYGMGEFTTSAPGAQNPVEWRSLLQITEEGGVKSTLPNIELLVANDVRTKGIIAFNQFMQEVVLIRRPRQSTRAKARPKPLRQLDGPVWEVSDPVNGHLWSEFHDDGLRSVFESSTSQGGYDIKCTERDLKAAIGNVAQLNGFHPVRAYLMSLEWDGVPRAERLFIDYLGAADNHYHRDAGRLTLLGAVARVFEPGHKFDFVPILEGVQGKRKSTFIKILAHYWSSELVGDFADTKMMVELTQGSWIMEIPELQGFSKAEVTTIKGFVSRTSDKARLAWGRRAHVYLRQCIFIGSTNDSQYLRDHTGGRRFWPIHCALEGAIDTDKLRRELDQIWAEARVIYQEMRRRQPAGDLPLYLSNSVSAAEAERLQESRRAETPEEALAGQIERWLDEPIGTAPGEDPLDMNSTPLLRDDVCVSEVWVEMLKRDPAALDQRNMQMVGRALKSLPGWRAVSMTQTKRYGRQRIMRRIDDYTPA